MSSIKNISFNIMDDKADLERFMYIMDQYYRAERGGGRMPVRMFESLERVLQSPAAIEQDFINQLIMINIGEDELMTPLQDVYEYGYLDLFEIFLKNGADPNTRVVENHVLGDETILMYCTRKRTWTQIKYVELLLQYGADVHKHNGDGDTVLVMAERSGNPEVVELIKKYINLQDDVDESPDEPDREQRRSESARVIQKRLRGNRTRRLVAKKPPRYGTQRGPATRRETMRRWMDLSKQFDDDDEVKGYLDPFNRAQTKKIKKRKRKPKTTKERKPKTTKKRKPKKIKKRKPKTTKKRKPS